MPTIAPKDSITHHPTSGGGHPNESRPPLRPPTFTPPPVTLSPKPESLDRRIRNLEALGNGVFIGNVLASYMALPGLVGFWPMSSVQRSTGNAYDLSGQGRTLTYNGNPAYTYFNGLVPYIDLDGTGDFLSRVDETDLDIIGNETIYTTGAAGLTVGGWFWADTTTANAGYITKYDNTVAGSAFALIQSTTDTASFILYSGVTQYILAATNSQVSTGAWHFIVGKWSPGAERSLYIDSNAKTTDTSIVPATLNNSAAVLSIGRLTVANVDLNGRAALCFLCANALGDDLISSLFQSSRIIFGV